MSKKAKVGITRDFLDKDGKWIMPGLGPKVLDQMGVEYRIFSELLPEVSPKQIDGLDMVIGLSPRWTKETLARNEKILAVMRRGVGYDNVDVAALNRTGVLLTITRNAIRRGMSISVMCFLLALSLRLLEKDKLLRESRWAERPKTVGYGLPGRTLGIIGVGSIGHDVFRLAKPFEMKHIAYDPYVTPEAIADVSAKLVDMDTVLSESDFLSINCPLSEETYHWIGEKELKKMKKTAFLINTSRGPVVDEPALIRALQEGWIRGAALDVFEQEPVSSDNPLLSMDNVIVTPHNIGWTDRTMMDQWDELMEQVSQIIRGEEPIGLVNREAWDSPMFQSKLKKFLASVH